MLIIKFLQCEKILVDSGFILCLFKLTFKSSISPVEKLTKINLLDRPISVYSKETIWTSVDTF